MHKQEHVQTIVEWIKKRAPRWSWLHALLDAFVGEALAFIGFLAVSATAMTLGIIRQFDVDPLAMFLIVIGTIGSFVTCARWYAHSQSMPPPQSKQERRLAELLAEAKNIDSYADSRIWLKAASGFLFMRGASESWEQLDRLEKDLSVDVESTMKEAVNIFKNYAATSKESGN